MKRLAAVLLLLCSCASIETFPQANRCVYDSQKREIGRGTVISKRDDGARLVQFNDTTIGDHGYLWVTEDGTREIRPCQSSSDFDASRNPETKGIEP